MISAQTTDENKKDAPGIRSAFWQELTIKSVRTPLLGKVGGKPEQLTVSLRQLQPLILPPDEQKKRPSKRLHQILKQFGPPSYALNPTSDQRLMETF